jgi:3-isopropylmalate/(R)-2-methylmalate dehydratase small subunit
MKPFSKLKAVAAPYALANVDTDRIVPARFLRKSRSAGYGKFLFHDQRHRPDGSEDPDFFLNEPRWRGAAILVAGENFGCGSSREAAVWALEGWGFRAWIAPSFGEIFQENTYKNGLLPVALPAERVARIRQLLEAQPGAELTIDLAAQTIALPDGSTERFEIDPFRKQCLLNGWDDIDLTLQHEQAIAAYEARQRSETPWLTATSA